MYNYSYFGAISMVILTNIATCYYVSVCVYGLI